MPFWETLRKIQNILETIEGMNGIKILKPTGNDGYGWRITKDADETELPEGSSSDVALKWDNVALKWVAVLPVDTINDEQSDTLEDGDRVVTGIKTGGSGKLIQLITKPLGESGGGGGVPDGYEEETLNIITDAGIVTRKVLVETSSKASVEAFSSSDSRLLLSINTSGVVRKSKGYLKA